MEVFAVRILFGKPRTSVKSSDTRAHSHTTMRTNAWWVGYSFYCRFHPFYSVFNEWSPGFLRLFVIMPLTCLDCMRVFANKQKINRLTWSFGRNKTPISYERIISCWPFFSSVPQAAFDKLALERKKFVYKVRWGIRREVCMPSKYNDKNSVEELIKCCNFANLHQSTRTVSKHSQVLKLSR